MTASILLGDVRYVLTPWFAAAAAPQHVGVYERESSATEPAYACWDGRGWRRDAPAADAAAQMEAAAVSSISRWRGLTESAAGPCTTCGGHTVLDAGVDDAGEADLISECPDC